MDFEDFVSERFQATSNKNNQFFFRLFIRTARSFQDGLGFAERTDDVGEERSGWVVRFAEKHGKSRKNKNKYFTSLSHKAAESCYL
jgi:hypothetical protein